MGRARGFIILLVLGIPLFWYTYRDAKKGPVDDTPKHDKVFSVDAGKIDDVFRRKVGRGTDSGGGERDIARIGPSRVDQ